MKKCMNMKNKVKVNEEVEVTKKSNVTANIKKEIKETKKEESIKTVKPKMKQSNNPLPDQEKNETSAATTKPVKTNNGDKEPPTVDNLKMPLNTTGTTKKPHKKSGKIIDVENENPDTEDEEEDEWTRLEDALAKFQQPQPAIHPFIQQQK